MIGEGININPFQDGLEDFTGYYGVIDSDHAYIHKGIAFTASGSVTLADSAILYISFVTPSVSSGKYVHLRPATFATVSSACHIQFFEGSTSSGGVSITPTNRNRNSSNICDCSVKSGVVVTDAGLFLTGFAIGSGGSPQSRGGGSAGGTDEYVLKPETEYLTRIENVGGASSLVTFSTFWYEEGRGV